MKMKKRFAWIPALCLAVPMALAGADGGEAKTAPDPIPQKELRTLLKENSSFVAPAAELIYSMGAEEREQLRDLFQRDRDAARKFLLDKLEARQILRRQELKEISDLARQARESKDETEKERLRTKLRTLLAKQFQRTSDDIALRIRMQEQRLAEVRRVYEERQAKSDQAIDAALEKLTQKRVVSEKKKNKKKDAPETPATPEVQTK